MATYDHKHDRGCANLCEIVRAETPAQRAELESYGYERLTVAELRKHVRWVNGETEAMSYGTTHSIGAILGGDEAYSFDAVIVNGD